ncbi:MAG: DsrE family protein [Candidatus Odinarchaeia archaeon]
MTDKIVFIVTVGQNDPEKATIPFILGNAALASDTEVVYFLQSEGVMIAKKGVAEKINAENFPKLKELLDGIVEAGVPIYLCSPCVKKRNIKEDEIIEGAKVASAATVIDECLDARVLTY